jgi:hypothetical protein
MNPTKAARQKPWLASQPRIRHLPPRKNSFGTVMPVDRQRIRHQNLWRSISLSFFFPSHTREIMNIDGTADA